MRDFTLTEALEAYPVARRIDKHFKDHCYMTEEDYEKIKIEEYQKIIRQESLEDNGGAGLVIVDNTDLPI